MIAVAVAASLVTYAWVMGYLGFTTNKVGKAIQVQSVSADSAFVQNVGDSKVIPASFYVNGVLDTGATFTIGAVDGEWGVTELAQSQTAVITPSTANAWSGDAQVTIKIVTTDGTSAEFTKTFP
jgi:hypothetical protein